MPLFKGSAETDGRHLDKEGDDTMDNIRIKKDDTMDSIRIKRGMRGQPSPDGGQILEVHQRVFKNFNISQSRTILSQHCIQTARCHKAALIPKGLRRMARSKYREKQKSDANQKKRKLLKRSRRNARITTALKKVKEL